MRWSERVGVALPVAALLFCAWSPWVAAETPEAAPSPAAPSPAAEAGQPGQRADGPRLSPLIGLSKETWDWNLELMVGPVLEPGHDAPPWTFATRMRGGLNIMRGEHFWQLGATAEITTFEWDKRSAFGAQVELLHFTSGFWWQLGGFADLEARGGMSASAGWTLFAFETQFRTRIDEPVSWAVFFKLRAPLRMLFPMF